MDRFIASLPGEADGDLMLCRDFGVAYQIDQSNLCAYDDAYYNKCASYEGQEIANKINAGRIALVNKYVGTARVVDVGIGSGEFIKSRPNTWGHDVNPAGIEWLRRNDLWAKSLLPFAGATFWDVLEHVPTPEEYLKQIQLHSFLFCSIPLFYALGAIRASKHYRPNEHLYYFTEQGFVDWMERHGFLLLGMQDFEIQAGRESIYSFAFKRNRWPKPSGE
jgi:hypothetical protein